jgi:hypothetical protein
MKLRSVILWTIAVLASGSLAHAAQITIQFDELTTRPADNVTIGGVTFGFTVGGVPSLDATYNFALGMPGLAYASDPVLEGTTAGTLALVFAVPTSFLRLSGLLAGVDPLDPGFSVQLYDANLQSMGTIPVAVSPVVSLSEAQFTYNSTAIRRAELTFSSAAPRFAIDNVTYTVPDVPEPGTLWMILSGGLFIALGCARRRRR